jgi:integrase
MARYRIAFVLHAKAGSDVKYLECRLKWESSTRIVALSMGYRVDPDKWVAEAQRCKAGSFHGPARTPAAEINAEIERYVAAAARVFAARPEASRDEVATAMRAELGRPDRRDLPGVTQAYRQFCAEQAAVKGWTASTVAKMDVTGRHIEDSGLLKTFADVTKANLNAYLSWLRDDLGLTDTTAHRQIANLRWFLFWCEDRGYVGTEWRSFKPKFRQPDKPVIFLEWDELMRVWNYEGPAWKTDVRDVFCFCAFTGLRYSDAHALSWADVGEDAIRVTTLKTYDALTIELNKWSREILERRKGKDEVHVFPRTTNQVMNRALKEICKECGIDTPVKLTSFKGAVRSDEVKKKWEVIGTHAARRTFVVNALQMGVSPTVVMSWTGHSDYKAMKPYIAVADSARAKAMAGFDKLENKAPGAADNATPGASDS